jgi:hypothetical protein
MKNLSILLTELAKSVMPNQISSAFNAPDTVNTKMIKHEFISK